MTVIKFTPRPVPRDISLDLRAYLDDHSRKMALLLNDDDVSVASSDIDEQLFLLKGTVDLTSASAQNIGGATDIPIDGTIVRVKISIDTASDAVTTITVGDATNGAASYMGDTDNDPEVEGNYLTELSLVNGNAARQARATVATPGSVGSATCIITVSVP